MVGKKISVIGYGKIGQHVVRDLVAKKSIVYVYDKNPKKLIHALAEGYNIINKKYLLVKSDIIFCITGNKSLNEKDIKSIRKECYIFSITSSDDEFDFSKGLKDFSKSYFEPIGVSLIKNNIKIHLVNYGNSINFLHKAVIGNFIYLVQAEIIKSIYEITQTKYSGIFELKNIKRDEIAKIWLKYFQKE